MKVTGTIKVIKEKGFGFIVPDDGSQDVYFHVSQIRNTKFNFLNMGDKVEYTPLMTERGVSAQDVMVKTA